MKTFFALILSFLILFPLTFTSCKYEEGPSLSLRTKTSRMTGTWRVEKIIEEDGTEFTQNDNNNLKYFFNRNGTGDYIITLGGLTTSELIEWEFANNKENLKITYLNGNIANTKILRLTKEKLIVKTNEGDRWELDKQ